MAKAQHTTDARVLAGIDISKNRHEVLIAVPGNPASCSFIIPIICASVNRLFLMSSAPSQVGQTLHQTEGTSGGQVKSKTGKPVRFEITETTRLSLECWISDPEMIGLDFLWPSRIHGSPHLSTRQYARIVRGWVVSLGLEPSAYGTHSMRRTKVAQIYKKTDNLHAVQLLLGHTKMDSTVRYLGVDIEDALTLSEGIDL